MKKGEKSRLTVSPAVQAGTLVSKDANKSLSWAHRKACKRSEQTAT